MKKIFAILLMCTASMAVCAVDYTPIATQPTAPAATMQSVNNSSMMSSGSAYSSDIQAVGAYSPAAVGPRKAPPGTGGSSGYDPKTPDVEQPLGDALLPLMLFAGAFLIWRAARRRAVKE